MRRLLTVVSAVCLLAVTACSNPDVSKRKHLDKGNALAAQQKYADAILEYKNALKIDARYGEARLALADAYGHNKQPIEAARQYVAAAEVLPNDERAQTQGATLLLAYGEYERAKQHAQAALKINPKNVEATMVLGLATAGLNDMNGAMKEMQEAVEVAPGDFRPYMSLGTLHAQAGEQSEAEASFKKAIELSPKSAAPHTSLGYYYWSSGRMADAERELKAGSALSTDDPSASRLLSLFYASQRRYADAETPLLRLVEQKDTEATFALGDLYLGEGHPEKARTLYQSLVNKPATKGRAVARIASIDYASGKKQDAHAALDAVLKEQPNNVELLSLQSRWYMNERRMDDALGAANKAVAADPSSAPAQYVLGLVYAARQEMDPAEKAFKETLRLNPRMYDAQVQLSRLSLAGGKTDQALAYAEAANKQQVSPAGRAGVVTALLAKGDYPRADRELQAMEKEYPNLAKTHTLKGVLLGARGDQAAAAKELDRALALDPGDVQALTARLQIDIRAKDVEAGRARLSKALAANPANGAALVVAARFENSTGDTAAGEKYLKKSIEVDPSNLDAYVVLARMYIAQKRLDDARSEFQQVAAKQPSQPGPKTMVGVLYDMQGRYDDSQKVYEDVLRTSPRAGVAANNLAFIYATKGTNLDQALQLAQTAKQQMPAVGDVDDTLGFVYYKKGLPELAVPPLMGCLQREPRNVNCQFHLGMAQAKAGQKDKAIESLQKALELQPSFAGADEARSTLASLKK